LIEACDVPDDLADLHYHDLSTPERYTIGFANLIRDLDELEKRNMPGQPRQPQSNGTSTGSQFYMPNLKAERSQFGNENLMINKGDTSIDTARLMQRVKHILQSEHQQLRIVLLAELASMNADQKQHIEMILNHYQRGQITQQDFHQFMTTMQALVQQLQAGSLSANNQLIQISQQLEQVYNSSISQQHQFEVTIPVIPAILDYKYQFGASMDTDVRNLIERIQELWSQMRNPHSSA
jgi:hypothetical protein